jgi:hypothetical protein
MNTPEEITEFIPKNQPMLKRFLGVEDDSFSAKEEIHETVFCHRRARI